MQLRVFLGVSAGGQVEISVLNAGVEIVDLRGVGGKASFGELNPFPIRAFCPAVAEAGARRWVQAGAVAAKVFDK